MATQTTQPTSVTGVQNNSVPVTTGENPLSDSFLQNLIHTATGEAGGGTLHQQAQAFVDFQKQFGRNPTQSELNSISPSYQSSDPNSTNNTGGLAAISQYFLQQQNTPQNLFNQQQQQATQNYNKNQSQLDNTTQGLFQQLLGRQASQAELQHFGTALANGSDPYEIQQSIMQTPEYQQIQTKNASDQLSSQLQGTNSQYFNQYILPSIQSQFASQGRSFDSSGFQNATAQAAKQQNYDLQNYLAQFRAGQYGQSVQNAAANYQPYLQQQYNLQNSGVSNSLYNQGYNIQRNNQLQDYYNQLNAYNQYLNQYGKRSGTAAGLTGALQGGVAGGLLGSKFGPWGAALGGLGGAGLGGASGAAQF